VIRQKLGQKEAKNWQKPIKGSDAKTNKQTKSKSKQANKQASTNLNNNVSPRIMIN